MPGITDAWDLCCMVTRNLIINLFHTDHGTKLGSADAKAFIRQHCHLVDSHSQSPDEEKVAQRTEKATTPAADKLHDHALRGVREGRRTDGGLSRGGGQVRHGTIHQSGHAGRDVQNAFFRGMHGKSLTYIAAHAILPPPDR